MNFYWILCIKVYTDHIYKPLHYIIFCINNKRPFETYTSFFIWWACHNSADYHYKSVLTRVDVTMILVLFRNDLRYLIYHLGNNKVCVECRNREFTDG